MKKLKGCEKGPFTHPQIARKFPSAEVHKLCNKDSTPPAESNANESGSSAPIPVVGPN